MRNVHINIVCCISLCACVRVCLRVYMNRSASIGARLWMHLYVYACINYQWLLYLCSRGFAFPDAPNSAYIVHILCSRLRSCEDGQMHAYGRVSLQIAKAVCVCACACRCGEDGYYGKP